MRFRQRTPFAVLAAALLACTTASGDEPTITFSKPEIAQLRDRMAELKGQPEDDAAGEEGRRRKTTQRG